MKDREGRLLLLYAIEATVLASPRSSLRGHLYLQEEEGPTPNFEQPAPLGLHPGPQACGHW